jgi:biopolymer transport protein ExbB/TolQ
MGLFVAIPTVWSYNRLTEKLGLPVIEMEVASRELTTYFVKETQSRSGST